MNSSFISVNLEEFIIYAVDYIKGGPKTITDTVRINETEKKTGFF